MKSSLATGHNVYLKGIRQHYLRYNGGKQPLIIVPGITSPAAVWDFVAERICHHFDVYVLDVRGRGLSSANIGMDFGFDAMAEDLISFISTLSLKNVIVLGHSMGARIAARAWNKDPADFERLIMVDPPVSGPGRRNYPADLNSYLESIDAANRGISEVDLAKIFPTWNKSQLVRRAEWLHTCYPPAIEAAFEGFHTEDFHKDLGTLTIPSLLVLASRGGVVLDEDEDEILKINSRIKSIRLQDAGHMIPWDNLEEFLSVLGDQLKINFEV